MKYYLIAGERSGDIHTANLMRELKKKDENASFRFWGGDEMQKIGGELVKHYKETAFMGFLEVLKNIRKINQFLKECKKDIQTHQPNVLILTDYAGFNLRIAKFVKKNLPHIKIIFYISPKIWAWNTKRVFTIKKIIDLMLVILPFEEKFYQQYDCKVKYVGNPLLDELQKFQPDIDFKAKNNLLDKKIIALLPGSRKQEVKHNLPVMLQTAQHFPDYQFVVAGVSNLEKDIYKILENYPNIPIITDQTYQLLYIADGAIVASGTATLETGLFHVPQVVIYKMSKITFEIARRIVKLPYVSLLNWVGEKMIAPELLQFYATPLNIANYLQPLLPDNSAENSKNSLQNIQIKKDYQELTEKMGKAGASQKTAEAIWDFLNDKN
ncbi:MAG: lipid-A-disaccharide synthase [Bacteroidetes bacterium]|nr:MAG: lipid-A-disaccharide synthase [Bacteroidota bacterium]TAG95170.1 MAG: lipid-A-disaccharide synthase [Bacteroidota bacterium]